MSYGSGELNEQTDWQILEKEGTNKISEKYQHLIFVN
jgi:hypothetical protein